MTIIINLNKKDTVDMTVQSDFIKWEEQAKQCDIAALYHIINDCREARDAMRGWNPDKEAYYADQYWTFCDELRRRKHLYPVASDT